MWLLSFHINRCLSGFFATTLVAVDQHAHAHSHSLAHAGSHALPLSLPHTPRTPQTLDAFVTAAAPGEYIFDPDFLSNCPEAKAALRTPAAFEGVATGAAQFMAGPAGTGAPVHFHKSAWNACLFGRRRWALFPPNASFMSVQPVESWWTEAVTYTEAGNDHAHATLVGARVVVRFAHPQSNTGIVQCLWGANGVLYPHSRQAWSLIERRVFQCAHVCR